MKAVLALLVLLGSSTLLAAEPQVSRHYQYYQASGDSLAALQRSLHANTPVQQNGQRFHAYTDTRVNWRFWWWEEADGRCRIERVETRVDITFTLPQLSADSRLPNSERIVWERYLAALTAHEEGHARLGIDTARNIQRGILALPQMTSCAALERSANSLGEQALQRLRGAHIDYDRRTGHGASQGARLP